ncbi:MAG: 16S rRNA (uracil(1498)-N(3))-methyltransferase [Gallionellaceae bacterium]|nr:16S rRNA (uracil(1498)-N(3))-methyltransferase [Gallionellaceae bacterium]
MSIPRFYCPVPLPTSTEFELPPAAAHHASRVLRLRVKDAVQLFDGTGHELHGHIREISGKKVVLEKLQACTVNRESPFPIMLAQALCSSEKMDWVAQKASELGVAAIQPVQTRRSVAKLAGERAEKRTEHWRGVIIAACEQCGRSRLPLIYAPQEFSNWIATMRNVSGQKFILLPEAAATLQQQPKPQAGVTLLIGPEGGFEEDEAQLAQQAGFVAIRLGTRILRTETAALAAITALQTLWGDL